MLDIDSEAERRAERASRLVWVPHGSPAKGPKRISLDLFLAAMWISKPRGGQTTMCSCLGPPLVTNEWLRKAPMNGCRTNFFEIDVVNTGFSLWPGDKARGKTPTP